MELTRRKVLGGFAVATFVGLHCQARSPSAQTGWRTPSGDWLETLPRGQFPAYLKNASPKAREMDRFTAANGDILRYIPCYCGCGNERIGHKSNADCYVAERFFDGRITFTSHAAG